MALLEMTTYLALLILGFFSSLFAAGYRSIQKFGSIIVAVFAWFTDVTLGMIIRLFITPILSWMGYGPKGSIVGFLGSASMILYGDFIPMTEFVAHLQRMATAWYTDW
ncbi:hypothetical protein ColTof4_00132 [Colletotrichum tofieldiae]|uniref:Uncharacterized protein n=1 Tax=Colletotrichum tofieldiae TaxID=708197 RepID=A0A166SQF4_9PEZI|nr:hypothetical protein CT0861_00290 [Colletotrichum tofieldiae]GKT59991.1 hypothetical protein ColTof3_07330 [Colletotrichum tofieldiae]GKT67709.1 hypothetical protein ColTof4_00132 [Colletotrichum tofieldiae]GKT91330.1 hypothetical protein Ct61P_09180 [Colletotrichum tofieldiae]